ncbi:hypothetical protein MRB53_022252 [Persea americana]|uniref:Uncharacterized protein n=1 Tax=Persea americana TaxID=3435 RepID=A0ACC2L662_PERAE|nr:hypothetical protein MRB53_022252 [Persea americana]
MGRRHRRQPPPSPATRSGGGDPGVFSPQRPKTATTETPNGQSFRFSVSSPVTARSSDKDRSSFSPPVDQLVFFSGRSTSPIAALWFLYDDESSNAQRQRRSAMDWLTARCTVQGANQTEKDMESAHIVIERDMEERVTYRMLLEAAILGTKMEELPTLLQDDPAILDRATPTYPLLYDDPSNAPPGNGIGATRDCRICKTGPNGGQDHQSRVLKELSEVLDLVIQYNC